MTGAFLRGTLGSTHNGHRRLILLIVELAPGVLADRGLVLFDDDPGVSFGLDTRDELPDLLPDCCQFGLDHLIVDLEVIQEGWILGSGLHQRVEVSDFVCELTLACAQPFDGGGDGGEDDLGSLDDEGRGGKLL